MDLSVGKPIEESVYNYLRKNLYVITYG